METKLIKPKLGHIKIAVLIVVVLSVTSVSCKKWLEVAPPATDINEKNVFNEDVTAIAAVTGMYATIQSSFTGYNIDKNISLLAGLSADEFTLYSGSANLSLNAHYFNRLIAEPNNSQGAAIWTQLYKTVFECNNAIKGLTSSTTLNPATKVQLSGEVYFIRAFCYFHLASLYGDAPLVLTTDPNVVISLPRSSRDAVFAQVIADLKIAQELLNINYVDSKLAVYASNAERIRPNRYTATALLARTYLYAKDYANAELESSKVIAATSLYSILPIGDVFLKNSREAIWQLQPIRSNRNTEDAFLFIIPTTGPSEVNAALYSGNPVFLSSALLSRFEVGDNRKSNGNWVKSVAVGSNTYNYPFKYKATAGSVSEYTMVFRLAEQYLIRAEARAQQSKLTGTTGAEADLNVVRQRAGLLPTTATATKEAMLTAILNERQVELFSEWGHRWLDLKRSGNIDAVMQIAASQKGGTWNTYQQWYPLPFEDVQRSPLLVQNGGY